MKTIVSLVAVTLLGTASAAFAQVNLPNPQGPGMSPDVIPPWAKT